MIKHKQKNKIDILDVINEILNYKNIYENLKTVKDNDSVLDLGCSQGFFYFKNREKNINIICLYILNAVPKKPLLYYWKVNFKKK